MIIPIIYEVTLFVFVLLGAYTVYSLFLARKAIGQGVFAEPYGWFIASTLFLILWAVTHIYNDLVPLPADLDLFSHYIVSHGLLLIAMVCLTVAAIKTKNFLSN